MPLAPVGPAFRQRVWALLRAIPYGDTRSYGALAADLGDIRLARAVGTANARNPLSIVVPCHRVVGLVRDAHRLRRRPGTQGVPAGLGAARDALF